MGSEETNITIKQKTFHWMTHEKALFITGLIFCFCGLFSLILLPALKYGLLEHVNPHSIIHIPAGPSFALIFIGSILTVTSRIIFGVRFKKTNPPKGTPHNQSPKHEVWFNFLGITPVYVNRTDKAFISNISNSRISLVFVIAIGLIIPIAIIFDMCSGWVMHTHNLHN